MKVGKYTIKWKHVPDKGAEKALHSIRGGERAYTSCKLDDGEREVAYVAICHPADNFCRDTGRRLSLARCMKEMRLTKEERKEIWEAYRMMSPKKRW